MIEATFKVKLVGGGARPLEIHLFEDLLKPQDAASLTEALAKVAADLRGPHQHNGTHIVSLTTRIDGKVQAGLSGLGVLTEKETAILEADAFPAIMGRNRAWIEKVLAKAE